MNVKITLKASGNEHETPSRNPAKAKTPASSVKGLKVKTNIKAGRVRVIPSG